MWQVVVCGRGVPLCKRGAAVFLFCLVCSVRGVGSCHESMSLSGQLLHARMPEPEEEGSGSWSAVAACESTAPLFSVVCVCVCIVERCNGASQP